jgi:hypothetical protein
MKAEFNTDAPVYLDALSRFPRYLRQAWHPVDSRRACFGDGSHFESGVRINANVAFCAAMLASDARYRPLDPQDSAGKLLARARQLIAYLADAHLTGPGTCADGGKWGGCWQSAWWATRLALGAHLVWEDLGEEQQTAIETLVAFEADHLLPLIVPSGLAEDTKAEENAWDTEVLAAAVALLPQHPHRDAWWDKLREFGFNIFSVARDRESDEILDGRPLRDWVYTVNLHSDYTLENHGAYHFCYVASPLHSLAWAHYVLRRHGIAPPAALSHHVRDVWNTAKHTFLDRRFAYVGGQDWARYTYGEYFIVPALVWLQDLLDDPDAAALEQARYGALRQEQKENDDGSFFGLRFTQRRYSGQAAKYETDCYANLALAHLWREQGAVRRVPPSREDMNRRLARTVVSPECGIAFGRGHNLFASFSWKTLTTPEPLALFVPLGHDDLAEWAPGNLFGRIVTLHTPAAAVWIRRMRETADGFEIRGMVIHRDSRGRTLYTQEVEYDIDLRQGVAEVGSRFVADQRLFVRRVEGLQFAIANDRFNGFCRSVHSAAGEVQLRFDPSGRVPWGSKNTLMLRVLRRLARETLRDGPLRQIPGSWVNIDGVLGIVALEGTGDGFAVHQPAGRNAGGGSLHFDRLLCPLRRPNRRFESGEEILRTRFRLIAGDVRATRAYAEEAKS